MMMTAHCGHRLALKIVLALSFCALLIGCDSHSSSPTVDKKMMAAHANSDQRDGLVVEQNIEQDALAKQVDSAEEAQSLISAAKPDRKSATNRSSMAAQSAKKSQLQATLIGDYKGVMPCSFCDSTQVLLNLFADGSVIKTSVYNNPQKPTASLTENGIYRQDQDTIIIVYDDQRIESYVIQNNHLILLDDNDIADDDYTLSRQ